MCNCTCPDDEAFGSSRDHELAAVVFIVLTILACGIFLAWPALKSACCPEPQKTEEEVDLALSLLQMGDTANGKPFRPPTPTDITRTYDGTHIKVHEMEKGSDSEDEDEVVPTNGGR